MIQTVTSEHIMPPWKSVEGHGSFVGERRLSPKEIGLITRWVEQGKPEGDSQDVPAAPQFTEGWKLGPPDIVVKMPEAYEVPAEGRDAYRNFVFALDVPKGKYIKAAEFRPSNRGSSTTPSSASTRPAAAAIRTRPTRLWDSMEGEVPQGQRA